MCEYLYANRSCNVSFVRLAARICGRHKGYCLYFWITVANSLRMLHNSNQTLRYSKEKFKMQQYWGGLEWKSSQTLREFNLECETKISISLHSHRILTFYFGFLIAQEHNLIFFYDFVVMHFDGNGLPLTSSFSVLVSIVYRAMRVGS